MSSAQPLELQFFAHRPPVHGFRLDDLMLDALEELRGVLAKAQDEFSAQTCLLDSFGLDALAIALVEFGEDIHCGIGLWRALESYQTEFFGMPLPFFLPQGEALTDQFASQRVGFFLQGFFADWKPDALLAPGHRDLITISEVASEFLADAFHKQPKETSITRFLRTPDKRAWDVKKKLVWAGRHSYLFRRQAAAYEAEHRGDGEAIDVMDDFVCQQCTPWSGLGVVDLLAATLPLPAADRADLRSWYHRHQAFYKVTTVKRRGAVTDTIDVINIINQQPYHVRLEMENCPFEPGIVVFGSLVPWRGEWYWSGTQRPFENLDETALTDIKKEFLKNFGTKAYVYCPDLAAKAREISRKHAQEFIKHYGDDLVVFPDGLSLAAAEQARLRASYKKQPESALKRLMKLGKRSNPWPEMKFSEEILGNREGIGAFYDPEEGLEYVRNFNHLISALRKRSEDHTEMEHDMTVNLICGNSSPAFVERLVREHGSEAIGRTFMVRNFDEKRDLPVLLRKYKGKYYRTRYPAIAFVQDDEAEAKAE